MFRDYVLAAAMSVFATVSPAMAMKQPVVVTVSVEHLRYHTDRPYAAVKADLERKLSLLDAHIRSLLAAGKTDELRAALEKASGQYGLVIHYVALHGDWLVLNGGRKNGIVYHIGNVLTAVQMTRENFGAGLYAPLRLAIYDDGSGTTLEYDKPSSLLGQFHDAQIDKEAASLDERMVRLVSDLCDDSDVVPPKAKGAAPQ